MNLSIETELEDDGRRIAEVPELPGVLAYSRTEEDKANSSSRERLWLGALDMPRGGARPGAGRKLGSCKLDLFSRLAIGGGVHNCLAAKPWRKPKLGN